MYIFLFSYFDVMIIFRMAIGNGTSPAIVCFILYINMTVKRLDVSGQCTAGEKDRAV